MNEEVERFRAAFGDRYVIEGLIGRGGMADVWRALDVRHGRPVAVKLLRPELGEAGGVDRFIREIEIAARLQHPNILPVYDSGNADGALFYIMPFVEGDSLRARLRREPNLPLDEVLRIVHEVADALGFAHQHNVVHRDIKPENILFSAGHAVVADFGIARAIELLEGGEHLTQVGLGLGTPEYMSPEQAFGEQDVDGRSDTYSLGCVAFELLTGRPPFTGRTAAAIIAHKTVSTAPHVTVHARDALPGTVDAVISRALARDRADRYASVQEFARALREAAMPDAGGTRRTTAARAPASIAVLPFVNVGGDPANDFLSDGISDELIHALARVPGLRVVARTSAFAFKGSTEDARTIAGRLRVQSLLEGTLRRAADRLRITVQLVDADTGFQRWSERYDRELTDVFAVQDEITTSIVESLRLALQPQEEAVTGAPTGGLAVYERYLEAKYHWNRRTEHGVRRSLELLEEAIALDPDFAPALASRAESYVTLAIYGQQAPEEAMPVARDAAERALACQPSLAEALAARGCVRAMYEWRWTEAEEDFRRAIDAAPQSPTAHQWYAMNLLVPRGRFDEARLQVRRARDVDPLSPIVAVGWGLVHYFERDFGRAIATYRELLERTPDFGVAHFFLGQALVEAHRPEEAVSHLQQAIAMGGESAEALATAGVAHAAAGRVEEARDAIRVLQARSAEAWVSPVLLAQLHAAIGDDEAALAALERAVSLRATDLVWVGVRPTFDRIRLAPRFQRLLSAIGLGPAAAA